MWHPDEGTIHAWIEEQLPADEAGRVSAHVEKCDECQTAVREARGVIAGASRVVGLLDDSVGAGTAKGRHATAPHNGATERRDTTAPHNGATERRGTTAPHNGDSRRRAWMAVAATVVIAVGSMFVVRGRPGVETARERLFDQTKKPVVEAAPAAGRAGRAGPATSNAPTVARPKVDSGAKASAANRGSTAEVAHAQPGLGEVRVIPPAPVQPSLSAAVAAPSPPPAALGGAAAGAPRQSSMKAAAEIQETRAQNIPTVRAPAGAARAFAPTQQRALDVMGPASFAGCYQLTPTVESQNAKFTMLPRQFALSTIAIDSVSVPKRVVSRVVGGRLVEIPEFSWFARGNGFMVAGGTAGSLMASASGSATALDSTGSQQLIITKMNCP